MCKQLSEIVLQPRGKQNSVKHLPAKALLRPVCLCKVGDSPSHQLCSPLLMLLPAMLDDVLEQSTQQGRLSSAKR